MRRQIAMIVRFDGQVRIETHGFAGPSCREASRFLENALGTRESEQLTAEFYQQTQSEQRNSLHG